MLLEEKWCLNLTERVKLMSIADMVETQRKVAASARLNLERPRHFHRLVLLWRQPLSPVRSWLQHRRL